MSRDTFICLMLACVTMLLFAPVREHAFIAYDDPTYMQEPHVRTGLTLDGARWAFTTFYFANWHPVTWLSLMLDTDLFGDAPGGALLTNVVLHAINAVLVYLLWRSMTGSTWASLIVAVLFAVHPLRVGSVAWASERKGLLSAMFSLGALLAYVRYVRSPRAYGMYATVIALFALALMSKPMAVTLPFVFLLLDLWPLGRLPGKGWRRVFLEKLPLVVLAGITSVVTFFAQQQGGGISSVHRYPIRLRMLNALWAYGRYVWLSVWPRGLTVFYPYAGSVAGTLLPVTQVVFAAATLATLFAIAIRMWPENRGPLIGLLWFVGCLVPVIGVVQVGDQSMADRYSYFPQIGLIAGMVFGIAPFIQQRSAMIAWTVATSAVVAAFSIRASIEIGYWANDITLFSRALEVTDHNYIAHDGLGYAFAAKGERAAAESQYRLSIADRPDYYQSHMEVANILQDTGRLDEALPHYRYAIERAPKWFLAHYNFGLALARNGREGEALSEFAAAVKLSPAFAAAHYAYGLALLHTGHAAEASQQLDQARALAQKQHLQGLLDQIQQVTSASAGASDGGAVIENHK